MGCFLPLHIQYLEVKKMKFIAQGGAASRHSLSNTKDSIVLALNSNYIDGVAFNLYLTKDNRVVLFASPYVDGRSNAQGMIKDKTFQELQQINFGSKVHRQHIMNLENTLSLFYNTTKILVLNLNDEQERNKIFVDAVIDIVKNYPNVNLYLKSSDRDTVLYLNTFKIRAKVGIALYDNDPDIMQHHLDFYSFCSSKVTKEFVRQILKNNRFIMLEGVETTAELQTIYDRLNSLSDDIFIITEHVPLLAAYYFAEIQNGN